MKALDILHDLRDGPQPTKINTMALEKLYRTLLSLVEGS